MRRHLKKRVHVDFSQFEIFSVRNSRVFGCVLSQFLFSIPPESNWNMLMKSNVRWRTIAADDRAFCSQGSCTVFVLLTEIFCCESRTLVASTEYCALITESPVTISKKVRKFVLNRRRFNFAGFLNLPQISSRQRRLTSVKVECLPTHFLLCLPIGFFRRGERLLRVYLLKAHRLLFEKAL